MRIPKYLIPYRQEQSWRIWYYVYDVMHSTQTRVRKLEQDLKREERLRRPVSSPASPSQRLQEQKELTEFQATAIDQLSYRNQALEVRYTSTNRMYFSTIFTRISNYSRCFKIEHMISFTQTVIVLWNWKKYKNKLRNTQMLWISEFLFIKRQKLPLR